MNKSARSRLESQSRHYASANRSLRSRVLRYAGNQLHWHRLPNRKFAQKSNPGKQKKNKCGNARL